MPLRSAGREMLMLAGEISVWRSELHLSHPPGHMEGDERTTGMTLEVSGDFTEPVKGVTRFTLMLGTYHGGGAVARGKTSQVGAFYKAKPSLLGSASLSLSELQLLLILLASGQRLQCTCYCQQPHYGNAAIQVLTFATSPSVEKGSQKR